MMRRSYLMRAACCALVAFLALGVTWWQMERTQMLRGARFSIDRYIAGTADRPFCYRVLAPTLLRILTPELAKASNADPTRALNACGLSVAAASKSPEACIALAFILLASVSIYAAISGKIYRDFFSDSPHAACIGSVGALLFLVPILRQGNGHIYDFSVLMFHAAMLFCIAQRRLRWYIVLFAVSCLNKETTILMIFAYAACLYDCIPRRRFIMYLVLQAAIFGLVYGAIHWYFQGNTGATMETHLSQQMSKYLGIRAMGGIIAAGILVAYRWSEKPLVFRRAMFMLVPHLALWFWGAAPGETRNLYESAPLLALFSIRTVELATVHWAGRAFSGRFQGSKGRSGR